MKVKHSRFSVGVILFALAMLPTMAQERAAQIREKLLNRNLHSVIVVSHRADWRNFPENSLDRKSTRLNSSHKVQSRMPSSA